MSASVLRRKVLEEINRVPEEKLGEVYEVIHFFRLGVETLKNSPEDIMQFAAQQLTTDISYIRYPTFCIYEIFILDWFEYNCRVARLVNGLSSDWLLCSALESPK